MDRAENTIPRFCVPLPSCSRLSRGRRVATGLNATVFTLVVCNFRDTERDGQTEGCCELYDCKYWLLSSGILHRVVW
jgi:hypothetical protein